MLRCRKRSHGWLSSGLSGALVVVALLTTVNAREVLSADIAARIHISETFSGVQFAGRIPVRSDVVSIPLPPIDLGDEFPGIINPHGGSVRVRSEGASMEWNGAAIAEKLAMVVSAPTGFRLRPYSATHESRLVLEPYESNGNIEDVEVLVFREGRRAPEVRQVVEDLVAVPLTALNLVYILPQFRVYVAPCRTKNAFSNPDILVCTELLADLQDKKVSDALYPILLHEIGHSVLSLWGLPGHDNEDMADEFAAAFLAKYQPETIEAYARWLESRDSVQEAVVQLAEGSRHSLSIQRARNMRALVRNPEQLVERWSRLLAPFVRASSELGAPESREEVLADLGGQVATVSGVCSKYVRAGKNVLDQCGTSVVYLRSNQGTRDSFIVQTLDQQVMAFSGPKLLRRKVGVVLDVDGVSTVMHAGRTNNAKAKGRCVYAAPIRDPGTLTCEALDNDKRTFAIRMEASSGWEKEVQR